MVAARAQMHDTTSAVMDHPPCGYELLCCVVLCIVVFAIIQMNCTMQMNKKLNSLLENSKLTTIKNILETTMNESNRIESNRC